MDNVKVGRYGFYNIFNYNTTNGLFTPLYNVNINGILFPQSQPNPQPANFGGLSLYNYLGKDIAGIWDKNTKVLEIRGFYP